MDASRGPHWLPSGGVALVHPQEPLWIPHSSGSSGGPWDRHFTSWSADGAPSPPGEVGFRLPDLRAALPGSQGCPPEHPTPTAWPSRASSSSLGSQQYHPGEPLGFKIYQFELLKFISPSWSDLN